MTDEFNNPFKQLKQAKLDLPDAEATSKPGAKIKKAAPAPPPEPAQNPYKEDDALFLAAMGGAKALRKKHREDVRREDGDSSFGELLAEHDKRRKAKKDEASAPSAAAAPAPRPEPARPVRDEIPALSGDDEMLFARAMGDVAPMDGKGRDLPKETPPPEEKPEKNPDALAHEHLRDLVRGTVEFQLEFTDEYQHGHVAGLDPKIFNKLRAGSYATEAHLDLHGMNADQALIATVDFIRASYTMGKRHLILVTGRGKNSPDGRGILRDEVQTWLTHEPLRRVVLAFVTAQPRDGGAGALYVLLRKFKKSLGKVQWDRIPQDWSLYD